MGVLSIDYQLSVAVRCYPSEGSVRFFVSRSNHRPSNPKAPAAKQSLNMAAQESKPQTPKS